MQLRKRETNSCKLSVATQPFRTVNTDMPGRNSRRILLLLLCSTLFTACIKKPLDQAPAGQYTTANFWRNQSDVIAGVLGIYNILYREDWVGHNLYVYDDQSDDICVDGDHSDFKAIERFNIDPTLQNIYLIWPFAYEQIGRANNAILYIPQVPAANIDGSIRNRSLGEAYLLRAHAYLVLSQIYGEVPLIRETNVQAVRYNVAKSPVDSIRLQVENDLLKAASLLPETYDDANKGRVSKGTAWGLLTKLYMIEDRFSDAITYGSKVVNNANYALAPNYADNFTLGKQESSTELLFAVWNKNQEIPNVPTSSVSTYFTPRPWQGYGFHHPTQSLASEFEADDTIRKRTTLLSVGDSIPYQTTLVPISTADAYQFFAGREEQSTGRMLPSYSTTGYCIRKYTSFMPNGDGGLAYDLKQPLLRSADVYLLVAEAKIRSTGPGSGDAELNAVRLRAGLKPLSGAGMPQLIHERRVELAGENIRHQDVLRWDKAKILNLDLLYSKPKTASPLAPYYGAVVVPARVFVRPKHYYMPLPQQVIDESKGIILQNTYY